MSGRRSRQLRRMAGDQDRGRTRIVTRERVVAAGTLEEYTIQSDHRQANPGRRIYKALKRRHKEGRL